MVFPIGLTGNFSVIVSIYAADGSVAVCTGGVECGQGINTKVLIFVVRNSLVKIYTSNSGYRI